MFKRLLRKLSSELTRSKIPYMIIGGQAVLVYGEPRLTKDIDVTLGVDPSELEKVARVVKKLRMRILVENYTACMRQGIYHPLAK